MTDFIIENGELKKYWGCGDVVIPDEVTVIGEAAFWNNDITSVKLPKGLKRIKESAFAGCRGLNELDLPDSVFSIGKSAFARTGIETIRLSPRLKQIPRDAFHSSYLHEIVLPDGIKSIGSFSHLSREQVDLFRFEQQVDLFRFERFHRDCQTIFHFARQNLCYNDKWHNVEV